MCLIVNTGYHNTFVPGPKVAKEDIVVVKELDRGAAPGVYESPFQHEGYLFQDGVCRKKYNAPLEAVRNHLGFADLSVHEGYHSYYGAYYFFRDREDFNDDDKVLRFKIGIVPKGAEYFIGTLEDIVSDELVVYEDAERFFKDYGISPENFKKVLWGSLVYISDLKKEK